MDVSVNYLAVLFAAVSAVLIGRLWYSPARFYSKWVRLTRVTTEATIVQPENRTSVYVAMFFAALVMAYALAYVAFLTNDFFRNAFLQDALMTAFWLWTGFILTRFVAHDAHEGRFGKLTTFNAGYELVSLMVMGLVIGVMGY